MRTIPTLLKLASPIVVASLLAGCGGVGSTPAALPGQNGMQQMQSADSGFASPDSQKVKVSPSKVVFTSTNPGPFAVTITGPKNTYSISESDDCAAQNIATVAGSGNAWTATGGTVDGVCHALFTAKDQNGKKLGNGNLKLTNKNGADIAPDSEKVEVAPNKVVFTTVNPGPFAVTVTGPKNTFSISESDDCAAQGIATIAGSGSTWTATAGANKGVCHALFTAKNDKGKKLGNGELKATNKI